MYPANESLCATTIMSNEKPTIVLIPGAWHQPHHYSSLTSSLSALGFPIRSLKLPSVNAPDPAQATIEADAAFVREKLILPELAAGKDVIIVAHSYGGAVAGAAAKGLGREDRGEGKPAVLGWLFLCAILGFTGKKILSKKEDLAPWATLHEETGQCTIPDPATCVYTHVRDAEAVRKAAETVGTHSYTSFSSESPLQAWEDAHWERKRVYVRCEKDDGIPCGVQDMMLEASGVNWEVENLEDAGHSPFMSHVPKLTELVDKYSKLWA